MESGTSRKVSESSIAIKLRDSFLLYLWKGREGTKKKVFSASVVVYSYIGILFSCSGFSGGSTLSSTVPSVWDLHFHSLVFGGIMDSLQSLVFLGMGGRMESSRLLYCLETDRTLQFY